MNDVSHFVDDFTSQLLWSQKGESLQSFESRFCYSLSLHVCNLYVIGLRIICYRCSLLVSHGSLWKCTFIIFTLKAIKFFNTAALCIFVVLFSSYIVYNRRSIFMPDWNYVNIRVVVFYRGGSSISSLSLNAHFFLHICLLQLQYFYKNHYVWETNFSEPFSFLRIFFNRLWALRSKQNFISEGV